MRAPEYCDLLETLAVAQRALAMVIDPETVKSTTVLNAWVQLVEAETVARTVLARARGLSDPGPDALEGGG